MGEVRRRRPWLAVLLALVISGLGHAYLRRWGRALGWYIAITATFVFFVPDGAVDQLFTGTLPPVEDIVPALIVMVASVADAYVLAVRNNRKHERQASRGRGGTVDTETVGTGGATAGGVTDRIDNEDEQRPSTESATAADCPHCGREVDPELDFCHWCTKELPSPDETTAE